MADISNQLEGVGEGLDRFLEALDDASYSLGSNAALQATQARAAKKIKDQEYSKAHQHWLFRGFYWSL